MNDYFTFFYVKHFELPMCMKCAIQINLPCLTFKFMVKPLPDHNYFLCFHRISIQGYMKTFREFAEKPLRNSESAGGSQENVVLLPQ